MKTHESRRLTGKDVSLSKEELEKDDKFDQAILGEDERSSTETECTHVYSN